MDQSKGSLQVIDRKKYLVRILMFSSALKLFNHTEMAFQILSKVKSCCFLPL